MKGSCIAINSNDGTESNAEQSAPEHLERRTIDSKYISTVSSLVAIKPEDDLGKSAKAKESQRNNFGLYALKFHRNLATHANSMFMNFKKDIGKRSKTSTKSSVNETTVSETPEFNAADRANQSRHEYFEPCHQQASHYNDGDGAQYGSEFDDCSNVDVWNNSNRFQRNRFKNDSDNVVNGPNARAPVRPRRIKPVAPKANSIAAHDIDAKKRTFPPINQQCLPYESTQSMDNYQNVMNI